MRKLIFKEIEQERIRQNEKWGEQNHLPVEWIAILTEEVGEAAKEAVDSHFIKKTMDIHTQRKIKNMYLKRYREELIQVAAVAVSMIESLDRNKIS